MIEVLFILQNFSVIIGRQKYIFFLVVVNASHHRLYVITFRILVMGLATLTFIVTPG